MAGMYENVLPPAQRKHRSGKPLIFSLVAIAVIVLFVTIYPVVGIISHQHQYKQFIKELSTYTTQAYYKQTLRAEVDGVSLRVTGDNAYVVYNALSALGAGQFAGQPPQEQPDATLYYGDQAVMKLRDVPLNNSTGRSSGVYVEFQGLENHFSYVVNGKDMGYFSTALSPEKNPLWEE